jgi:pimeloyl-ACP methyl ester carboxylesterase
VSVSPSPLNVETTGAGRDLVLLHGGAGGIEDLSALRDRLQAGRRIIAPDQRAHGRSPDLGELTYAAMASDTAALLDGLRVRNADFVGWSDGGLIALMVARDRPDLVRRAAAISANVSSAPPAPAAMEASSLDWARTATADEVELPAGRAELPGAAAAWPGIVKRLTAMWLADPGIDLRDLSRLTRRVLILAGDRDLVRTEHSVAMFKAIPDAELAIVPGATHRLPQTHAAAVAAIVVGFLDESDDQAGASG